MFILMYSIHIDVVWACRPHSLSRFRKVNGNHIWHLICCCCFVSVSLIHLWRFSFLFLYFLLFQFIYRFFRYIIFLIHFLLLMMCYHQWLKRRRMRIQRKELNHWVGTGKYKTVNEWKMYFDSIIRWEFFIFILNHFSFIKKYDAFNMKHKVFQFLRLWYIYHLLCTQFQPQSNEFFVHFSPLNGPQKCFNLHFFENIIWTEQTENIHIFLWHFHSIVRTYFFLWINEYYHRSSLDGNIFIAHSDAHINFLYY